MMAKIILRSIVTLGVLAVLFSCRGDLETIETITREEEGPVESAFNVEIIYSDHGHVRMIMHAGQMDRFQGEENFLEMPDGIHVVFYDTLMQETSSLSARYAISYEDSELIEARNDVIVINELGERLNTEELIWDQQKERIYSEKFVKVTTEEEVLYGEGFEADERFDQWRILRPHGTFQLDTRAGEGGAEQSDAIPGRPSNGPAQPRAPEPVDPDASVQEQPMSPEPVDPDAYIQEQPRSPEPVDPDASVPADPPKQDAPGPTEPVRLDEKESPEPTSNVENRPTESLNQDER